MNKMICQECNKAHEQHEFIDSQGDSRLAELVATNSNQSWRKKMCPSCWEEFKNRAFCSITRTGNTFTATCAF